ncbi:MAG: hypothetical protein JO151_10640 [Verrucomicrobia bacterium]|nr:hypothetical protein [Verrucomicrobiota bacterium]
MRRNPVPSDLKAMVNAGLRKFIFLFLSTIVAAVARGDDLTTIAGKTFHDIQVLSRNSSSLLIQSQEGEFQLSLTELKPADREKYSTDLTKAIDLPALTVIGEQKSDLSATPERSRSEIFAEKEVQLQEQQKQEARKKRVESYQPVQIYKGISFSLRLTDPKNDNAVQPSYLTPDYQRLAPEIVEKDVKVFSLSLQNP